MYTFTKRLLSASLICSLLISTVRAEPEAQFSAAELEMLETYHEITFVYVPDAVRDSFARIAADGCHRSRELCTMLGQDLHIARQDIVVPATASAIDMLKNQHDTDCAKALECLSSYKTALESGDAIIHVTFEESDEDASADSRGCCKKKKIKTYCSLCVKECLSAGALNVSGNVTIGGTLIVGGVNYGPLAGIAGAPGIAGAIGAAGAMGAPGTMGVPGIPGVGGFLAWSYIYALTTSGTVAIYNGTNLDPASVPFDSNGPLNGVTHTPVNTSPTGAVIGIVSAGLYAITFSVSGTQPNQFALFVNGVASASTIYGAGSGTIQNVGKTILALNAGDTLRVVNNASASAVALAQQGGTASNVYASILIVRIA